MSLPNFNEVPIPSDSESEDEYEGIEWSEPFTGTTTHLIVTIGALATRAFDCSTTSDGRVKSGELIEKETGRQARFYEIDNQTWLAYDKPFSPLALAQLREELTKLKWTKVTMLEGQAAQVSLVRPGLYGLVIGENEPKLSQLPPGAAAQGLAGALLTARQLGKAAFDCVYALLFTESMRSPEIEDLESFEALMPPSLLSSNRRANMSRYIATDKFKDNIYV